MKQDSKRRQLEPQPSVPDPRRDLLRAVLAFVRAARSSPGGRRLKDTSQTINLGADIFLADGSDHYLGRLCHYRECYARVACRALHCGQRQHLNDDLQIVTLSPALISAPPIDLWPRIVRRCAVPPDPESLLAELENDETLRDRNYAAAHDAI